jgi:hypothetical protein
MTGHDRREPRSASPSARPALVRVIRPGHPLEGLRLRVWDRLRLRGQPFLVVVLPDGSKKQLPACWTSLDGQDSAEARGQEVLAAPGDLLRAQLICGIPAAAGTTRSRLHGGARQEDDRAACTAQSAAGPGSGATIAAGQPASPSRTPRRDRERPIIQAAQPGSLTRRRNPDRRPARRSGR